MSNKIKINGLKELQELIFDVPPKPNVNIFLNIKTYKINGNYKFIIFDVPLEKSFNDKYTEEEIEENFIIDLVKYNKINSDVDFYDFYNNFLDMLEFNELPFISEYTKERNIKIRISSVIHDLSSNTKNFNFTREELWEIRDALITKIDQSPHSYNEGYMPLTKQTLEKLLDNRVTTKSFDDYLEEKCYYTPE